MVLPGPLVKGEVLVQDGFVGGRVVMRLVHCRLRCSEKIGYRKSKLKNQGPSSRQQKKIDISRCPAHDSLHVQMDCSDLNVGQCIELEVRTSRGLRSSRKQHCHNWLTPYFAFSVFPFWLKTSSIRNNIQPKSVLLTMWVVNKVDQRNNQNFVRKKIYLL